MIYCYPKIKGKEERHWFYEKWSEVPIVVFQEYNSVAIKIQPLEDQIKELWNKLFASAQKIAMLKAKTELSPKEKKEFSKLNRKAKGFKKRIDVLLNKKHPLDVKAISLFCSIHEADLVQMPTDTAYYDPAGREIAVELDDNHFQTYKNRFQILVGNPLPNNSIKEFYFQSKTDKEIKELEDQYKAIPFIKRFGKKARELKKKINYSKNACYQIQDIWLQTTAANKEFQDLANIIIEEFNQGDFSRLIYLVSMLTVESNIENEVLGKLRESTTNSSQVYLEKYRDEYLKIFKDRVKLFTEQEKKLDTATVFMLKNFFLSKWKK